MRGQLRDHPLRIIRPHLNQPIPPIPRILEPLIGRLHRNDLVQVSPLARNRGNLLALSNDQSSSFIGSLFVISGSLHF